jgi:hypothetical protein
MTVLPAARQKAATMSDTMLKAWEALKKSLGDEYQKLVADFPKGDTMAALVLVMAFCDKPAPKDENELNRRSGEASAATEQIAVIRDGLTKRRADAEAIGIARNKILGR